MERLLFLAFALGVLPLSAGLILRRRDQTMRLLTGIASALQCALAFNLTFFWQELWLVIPKALTPGLHPVLFHNNHDWTGTSKLTELLQGTGTIATLASGLAFSGALVLARGATPAWRLFFFWMAFQGVFQSLVQFAIGSLLPGNDMGRALAYLGIGESAKMALLALVTVAMAFTGRWMAQRFPEGRVGAIAYPALLSVILIVPFRLPRNVIEVLLVPLIINLIGTGWLTLGAALTRKSESAIDHDRGPAYIVGPAAALCATLLFFQLVLRPGIPF